MRRSLEFPNVTEMDCMLVHRIFHKFYEKQTSLLLCMQAQPDVATGCNRTPDRHSRENRPLKKEFRPMASKFKTSA